MTNSFVKKYFSEPLNEDFETSVSGSPQPHSIGRLSTRTNKGDHGIMKQPNGLFQCRCKEKFKTLAPLKNHIQIFSKEPALPCKLCDNRFYTVKYLKRHMNKKHRISQTGYMKACYDCGLVFDENYEYMNHLKSAQ